ncbi:hypothetical protein MKEN_01368200 [Mycena kentingensis (nom. inval.)]|nr:hypothetical protein MKEN_01368200 [Mycena kentingensis (nom. inval.)]
MPKDPSAPSTSHPRRRRPILTDGAFRLVNRPLSASARHNARIAANIATPPTPNWTKNSTNTRTPAEAWPASASPSRNTQTQTRPPPVGAQFYPSFRQLSPLPPPPPPVKEDREGPKKVSQGVQTSGGCACACERGIVKEVEMEIGMEVELGLGSGDRAPAPAVLRSSGGYGVVVKEEEVEVEMELDSWHRTPAAASISRSSDQSHDVVVKEEEDGDRMHLDEGQEDADDEDEDSDEDSDSDDEASEDEDDDSDESASNSGATNDDGQYTATSIKTEDVSCTTGNTKRAAKAKAKLTANVKHLSCLVCAQPRLFTASGLACHMAVLHQRVSCSSCPNSKRTFDANGLKQHTRRKH